MPFSTTIKYDVKIEKGPPPESVESKFDVDAYLPVTMTIPVKPAPRYTDELGVRWDESPESTEIILDAGSRDRIKFLLISASDYADPNCSKNPVALLLQFHEDAIHKATGDWVDGGNAEVIWLNGPLLFSGYTLAMLPEKVEKLYVKNYRGKDIELKILIGKSFMRPSNKPIVVGDVEQAAKAHRNGNRGQLVASR